MKKYLTLVLVLAFLLTFTTSTQALVEPTVNEGQGYFTVSLVPGGTTGFSIGGDFGITNTTGIFGEIGEPYSRLGLKYQLSPEFAVTGGYVVNESVFLGLNTSIPAADNLRIVGELGLVAPENDLSLMYQAGAIYDLQQNIDIRASYNGITSEKNNFKLGFGYSF